MEIRAARPEDAPAIWAILEPTIRLPSAFAHPNLGYVDALVMLKAL